jgi:hypothetical protein
MSWNRVYVLVLEGTDPPLQLNRWFLRRRSAERAQLKLDGRDGRRHRVVARPIV